MDFSEFRDQNNSTEAIEKEKFTLDWLILEDYRLDFEPSKENQNKIVHLNEHILLIYHLNVKTLKLNQSITRRKDQKYKSSFANSIHPSD